MHHLFVSRAGDSLVNVTQNRNTYRLLANFDGTNVILLQIDAGSVVWLTPDPERPVYLEYYTLLTGELTLHTDEGEAQTLYVGDSFYTTGFNLSSVIRSSIFILFDDIISSDLHFS